MCDTCGWNVGKRGRAVDDLWSRVLGRCWEVSAKHLPKWSAGGRNGQGDVGSLAVSGPVRGVSASQWPIAPQADQAASEDHDSIAARVAAGGELEDQAASVEVEGVDQRRAR
jgi:hypothetical protein